MCRCVLKCMCTLACPHLLMYVFITVVRKTWASTTTELKMDSASEQLETMLRRQKDYTHQHSSLPPSAWIPYPPSFLPPLLPFLPVAVNHGFNVLGHDWRVFKPHCLPHSHTIAVLTTGAAGLVTDYGRRGNSICWDFPDDFQRLCMCVHM